MSERLTGARRIYTLREYLRSARRTNSGAKKLIALFEEVSGDRPREAKG